SGGERFGALHAREATVPVGEPLRSDGADCGKDHAHQRGREERLDQRKACDGGAPRTHSVLRRSLTVFTWRTGPDGDCTRTTPVSGIQLVACASMKFA